MLVGVRLADRLPVDGERDVFGSDRFEQLAHHFSLPYFGPDPVRARL